MTQPESDAGRVVWDVDDISRALRRIAHQIIETNAGTAGLMLLGIQTRGVPLAERLGSMIADAEGGPIEVGALDITMYRDDLRTNPTRRVGRTHIPGGTVDGRAVVLVDDVLNSGRTVAAAIEALKDLGRPRVVRLAVLVDRGHRELPIQADHVGKELPTALDERVTVTLAEIDGSDTVTLQRRTR